jgi:hypothetical protein
MEREMETMATNRQREALFNNFQHPATDHPLHSTFHHHYNRAVPLCLRMLLCMLMLHTI